MTEEQIHAILKGKQLLFVDDKPSTLEPFKECIQPFLEEKGRIVQRKSLRTAMELLNTTRFDVVFIDLNIAPVPDDLTKYRENLRRLDLNHGQTLGMWLSDPKGAPYKPLVYAYLTAVPAELDRNANPSQENVPLIYKNFPATEFPERVCRLLLNATQSANPS